MTIHTSASSHGWAKEVRFGILCIWYVYPLSSLERVRRHSIMKDRNISSYEEKIVLRAVVIKL